MKFATNTTGEMITAGENAPPEALCPYCKGKVILRFRRRSHKPGDFTYFWRHENHNNPKCPARFRHSMNN